MQYQLPNGKVVQMTVDQFLDLTDEDIQYLMSINFGEYINSPWVGSVLAKRRPKKEESDIDPGIDYSPEDEDKSHGDNPASDEILLDDCHDIPDDSNSDI